MNVGIMCGSYDSASMESRLSNSTIVSALAMKDYTFVMGSGESGSMRDAKEIIRENGRMLISVGNRFELDRTTSDIKIEVNDTFERLKEIYKNSDVIIFLDGGLGTLSEFTAFLNNKVETKDKKGLIVWNPNGLYNNTFKDLEERKQAGLIDNYRLYFDEVKTLDDLAASLEKWEQKYNGTERSKVR